MPERSYEGKPIDVSWTDIQERPYNNEGELVDVTDPETGAETTTVGGDTELEREILEYHFTNRDATIGEVAEAVNCSKIHAWRVINRVSYDQEYGKGSFDELSQNQAKIIFIRAADPELTQRQIADQVGVSEGYVSFIVNHNPELIQQAQQQLNMWLPAGVSDE